MILIWMNWHHQHQVSTTKGWEGVGLSGCGCKAYYTLKLKLLYMLHQAPALQENDDFDMDKLASPA